MLSPLLVLSPAGTWLNLKKMKRVFIFLYLLLHLTSAEAQYPSPLPSSESISLNQIYNWMQAAGELPNSHSLMNLGIQQTHFPHKSSYSLRDWYGYHAGVTNCDVPFVVNHIKGDYGAPVTKTVTYGTVTSSLSGASECWITQNLGADQQAASSTDASDLTAGWYWQFNRIQGYSNIGGATSSGWTNSIDNNNVAWNSANDPCAVLGTNWRLPNSKEWTSANTAWGSAGMPTVYTPLKLIAAGSLNVGNGSLSARSLYGYYWSSTQSDASYGFYVDFFSGGSTNGNIYKAYGFSVRCLRN
jgi:hypothetical protein